MHIPAIFCLGCLEYASKITSMAVSKNFDLPPNEARKKASVVSPAPSKLAMESLPLRDADSADCCTCCCWTLRALFVGPGVVGLTTGAGGPMTLAFAAGGAAKAAAGANPDTWTEAANLFDVFSSICLTGQALQEPRLAMDTSSTSSSSSGTVVGDGAMVRGSNQRGSVMVGAACLLCAGENDRYAGRQNREHIFLAVGKAGEVMEHLLIISARRNPFVNHKESLIYIYKKNV